MVCQQAKSITTAPKVLLNLLSIPQQVWEDIAIDFICGLPSSRWYTFINMVIDKLWTFHDFEE